MSVMLSKLFALRQPRPADPGWPLDRIDVEACAAVWGLDKPVEYIVDPDSRGRYFQADEKPIASYWDDDGRAWLRPDLFVQGWAVSGRDGAKVWLLHVYAHEVAHSLTLGAGHNIEFAAVYAFLLARLPGDWFVDDVLRTYDVHTLPQAFTPWRRRSQDWRQKADRYALRTAAAWGCQLAEDPTITARRAAEIIRGWERERWAVLDRREQLHDRLTFAAVGVVGVVALVLWIWKNSRPLI